MTTWLSRIAGWLIAVGVAFAIGCYVGYDFRDDRVQAAQNEELQQVAVQINQDVVKSAEAEVSLVSETTEIAKNIDAIKTLAVKRVKAKENSRELPTLETVVVRPVEPVAFVDVGTVWLLDAARRNEPLHSASISDEAAAEASDVTLSEFVENDLEVVKLYHQLASEHRALIEAVKSEMRKREQVVPNYDAP